MKRNHTLIIGYGNCLRSDDGIGPVVADIVKSWKLPGVKTLALPQLVPELVDEIKLVEQVLFIDASGGPLVDAYAAYPLEPRHSARLLGHHETPQNVLAMVRDLGKLVPNAWMLEVVPHSFDYGDGLTEIAQGHVKASLVWVRAWFDDRPGPTTKSA